MLAALAYDLKLAGRGLVRDRGFTVVAMLSIDLPSVPTESSGWSRVARCMNSC